MARKLEDKVAVVTGGSSGIGKEAALMFAEEGARVVICDIRESSGEEVVRQITSANGDAIFVKCDISDPQQVNKVIDRTISTFGRLDCAFNNAGIESPGDLVGSSDVEPWANVIIVNLIGTFYCLRYEIPAMLKSGGGTIVNNASVAGLVGLPNASAYVASKHGVIGLTKNAAIEYATRGIRVNAVCPGFVDTPMLNRVGITTNADTEKAIAEAHPMKRLGRPGEIAALVVWLLGRESSFVTGAAIVADGGYICV